MTLIEKFIEEAKLNPKRVAFPEADDPKMMEAAFTVNAAGCAKSVLVGDGAKLRELCVERGFDPDTVENNPSMLVFFPQPEEPEEP